METHWHDEASPSSTTSRTSHLLSSINDRKASEAFAALHYWVRAVRYTPSESERELLSRCERRAAIYSGAGELAGLLTAGVGARSLRLPRPHALAVTMTGALLGHIYANFKCNQPALIDLLRFGEEARTRGEPSELAEQAERILEVGGRQAVRVLHRQMTEQQHAAEAGMRNASEPHGAMGKGPYGQGGVPLSDILGISGSTDRGVEKDGPAEACSHGAGWSAPDGAWAGEEGAEERTPSGGRRVVEPSFHYNGSRRIAGMFERGTDNVDTDGAVGSGRRATSWEEIRQRHQQRTMGTATSYHDSGDFGAEITTIREGGAGDMYGGKVGRMSPPPSVEQRGLPLDVRAHDTGLANGARIVARSHNAGLHSQHSGTDVTGKLAAEPKGMFSDTGVGFPDAAGRFADEAAAPEGA